MWASSAQPVDRRDIYRMMLRIAKVAGIPRQISPHLLWHAAITNALDPEAPLREAHILARHTDRRTIQHYDRAGGGLDPTASVASPLTSPASDLRQIHQMDAWTGRNSSGRP